jgi:hypothetical protein
MEGIIRVSMKARAKKMQNPFIMGMKLVQLFHTKIIKKRFNAKAFFKPPPTPPISPTSPPNP